MTTEPVTQTPSGDDQARVIERPDGFYWQVKLSDELYGPFPTLQAAQQDMEYRDNNGHEEGESLQEAEAEIGIADWIDPETGEPAEGLQPRMPQ